MKKPNKGTILFALVMAIFTVLVVTGYLNPLIKVLNSKDVTFVIGDISITPYIVLKAIFAIIIVFWSANKISGFIGESINNLSKIKAANRSLLVKTSNILVYAIAFIVAMNIIGIDLTALTIFSGALGIGLGFGLQKITSNFISGIIMLFESSVKQGDIVELESGAYGYICSVNARYTLVETYDGKEIMIPNEEFIVNRVTNWTYSNSRGRLSVNVGVSYDADIHLVQKIIFAAAENHPEVIREEEVKCYLVEFGDSSVNFLLFFWIDNFSEGRYRIQSDVLFKIWDEFKKNNIEIPFPQRDLHIKNPEALSGAGSQKPMPRDRSKKSVSAEVTQNTKRDKKKLH